MAQYISLLKYRLYRMSDVTRVHVVADLVEDLMIRDPGASSRFAGFLDQADDYCRHRTASLDTGPAERILETAGYDVGRELAMREAHRSTGVLDKVGRVVHIVGAPRSGTSFLYYSLVRSGRFAYFTSDSHHLWHAYGLRRSAKSRLENQPDDVLREDTKRLRLRHDMLLPSEAEHIWERAISCYRREGLHHYRLRPAEECSFAALRTNIRDHCAIQGRGVFLSKSPFNSLRMAALRRAFPGRTRFIHISRNPADCALSMTRNGFQFGVGEHAVVPSLDARSYFEARIAEADAEDVRHVSYEDVAGSAELIEWITTDVQRSDSAGGR